MPKEAKADWTAWNEERRRFDALDSQGFEADTATLEAHIKTLIQLAPKDTAGWLDPRARTQVNRLMADLQLARSIQRLKQFSAKTS